MRTAIYVYVPDPQTSAEFEFELSPDAVVYRYEGPNSESAVLGNAGKWNLAKGIYRVTSQGPLVIKPSQPVDFDVVAVVNDKDPWPDPPARFQATFTSVTAAILRDFLPQGKAGFGASPVDP
jgi:hypothetical protein